MKRFAALFFALFVALAPIGLAVLLSGCAATQAMNAKPVWGVRSDPDFGRCVYAGSWFGTAPGARSLLTAHACARVDNGSSPAPAPSADAGATPDGQ